MDIGELGGGRISQGYVWKHEIVQQSILCCHSSHVLWFLLLDGRVDDIDDRGVASNLLQSDQDQSCGIGKSKSREKSKNRKKSDKIGKIGFDFLLDFLAKMPKCHKMP